MLVYQINVTFESHFFLNNEIICFMLVVIYEKYSNLIELDWIINYYYLQLILGKIFLR